MRGCNREAEPGAGKYPYHRTEKGGENDIYIDAIFADNTFAHRFSDSIIENEQCREYPSRRPEDGYLRRKRPCRHSRGDTVRSIVHAVGEAVDERNYCCDENYDYHFKT